MNVSGNGAILERTDGITPIHRACDTNNNKIVKILLENGADPNIMDKFYNHTGVTTMHIAAMLGNIKMMQLLVEYGFNLYKLINKRMKGDEHRNMTVFLILANNGSVECLSYLLRVCQSTNTENKIIQRIDVSARTELGYNSLHLAVKAENLQMINFLLQNVYNTSKLRKSMMNQRSVYDNVSVLRLAIECAKIGSCDALSIMQLLNYTKECGYILEPLRIDAVEKLSNICINKKFCEYFGLFKILILFYLNHDRIDNLTQFYQSSVITYDAVESILEKICNDSNSVQFEWIYVVTTMLNAYTDYNLAMKMDPVTMYTKSTQSQTPKQTQERHFSIRTVDDVTCTKGHGMIRFNLKSRNILCIYCNKRSDTLSYACCKCSEYICQSCARRKIRNVDSKRLIAFLKERKFEQFIKLAQQYQTAQNIILDVC